MEHAEIARIAAIVGALGAGAVLLARGRALLLAGFLALAAAEAGLVLSTSEEIGLGGISAGVVAAAVAVGALALGGLAWLLIRRPALVPVLVLAAAPFRLPLDFHTSNRFIVALADDGQLGRLLPLYLVLAAAALALVWRAMRNAPAGPLPRVLAVPAAAFAGFACLSLLWADDLEVGAELLAFFTLPFAALVAIVARAPFPAWLPRALGLVAVVLAATFAAVGIWQEIAHELLFFDPDLEEANAKSSYFRVTSLFVDPSLYGRHVVLGLGVLLVALALGLVRLPLALGLIALMWIGLFFSYSQSSMTALIAVTLAVALATGGPRLRRAVVVAVVALALVAGGVLTSALIRDDSLGRETSDRSRRVEDTARVIADHPVVGVGIGGQPHASKEASDRVKPKAHFVSHTTPLTVTAELGAIGLALYATLLAGGVKLIDDVRRRNRSLGLGLGVAFLGLFVHSLSYSGFMEDPITWVVLALAAGYLVSGRAELTPRPEAGARAARPPAAGPERARMA
jgi:hypothetical protein